METLKVFNNENISEKEKNNLKVEKSVRAIIIDNDKKIALLYSQKGNFYVLPGGGIDDGELSEESVIRESREETGCNVEILKEVGKTIEVRYQKKIIKKSYCYLVKVIGEKGNPDFQEEELSEQFIINWFSIEEAKNKIKSNKNSNNLYYNYITERDLLFLNKVF